MISAVDASLKDLITGMNGDEDLTVAFDAPTREWASRQSSSSTVNCFLYEVREDPDRAWLDTRPVRNDDQAVVGRHPRVRHFKLSYLVTVWAKEPRDEHNVLDRLLRLFLDHPFLPEAHDTSMDAYPAGAYPVRVDLARPRKGDDNGLSLSDLWSAIGGELRPSLELVIHVPVVPSAVPLEPPAPPVEHELTLDTGIEPVAPDRVVRRRRVRTDPTKRREHVTGRERVGGHAAERGESGDVVIDPPGFGPPTPPPT